MSMQSNLIDKLLEILKRVKDLKTGYKEYNGNVNSSDLYEVFFDLETQICSLMSKMITAPMTGNLTLLCSRNSVTMEERRNAFQQSKERFFGEDVRYAADNCSSAENRA